MLRLNGNTRHMPDGNKLSQVRALKLPRLLGSAVVVSNVSPCAFSLVPTLQ